MTVNNSVIWMTATMSMIMTMETSTSLYARHYSMPRGQQSRPWEKCHGIAEVPFVRTRNLVLGL